MISNKTCQTKSRHSRNNKEGWNKNIHKRLDARLSTGSRRELATSLSKWERTTPLFTTYQPPQLPRQAPIALAMLVAERLEGHEATTVWALHKAEVAILEGQEFCSQRCRSWRFAAGVLVRGAKALHVYWAMGLTGRSHYLYCSVAAAAHREDSRITSPIRFPRHNPVRTKHSS